MIEDSPHNIHFLLLGSPSEAYLGKIISEALEHRCTDLIGKFSFAELLFVMSKCHLIISNDSGPMHLAAALSLPQIAIFGSTHPRLGFAPQNPLAIIHCADLKCQPCTLHGRTGCPQKHFDCMRSIHPDSIIISIKQALEL